MDHHCSGTDTHADATFVIADELADRLDG